MRGALRRPQSVSYGSHAPSSGRLPTVNSASPPAHDSAGLARHAGLLPAPDFAYCDEPLAAALARPDTLAVLGFGAQAPASDDPRYLRVGLAPLGLAAPLEVWRAAGAVRHGRDGPLRWASDGDWLFGALELDEAGHGGIAAASAEAYRRLLEFSAASACPHVLRVWNYLDAINTGAGDAERYRQFCSGRALGIGTRWAQGFPAASAIGRCDGVRELQVYWLAARVPGVAVENPRQVSAWRYPRQYGPHPPAFARALRAPTARAQLHVSGTAAVVGHASCHDEDLAAQLAETFANLDSLFSSAGAPAGFAPGDLVKVYLRRAGDAAAIAAALARRLPAAVRPLLLHGEICRRELLVEIDGVRGA